jgi:hypothetical protein
LLFTNEGKKNFHKFFDKSVINKKGRSSGFIKRSAKKITALDFVLGFIFSCACGQNTFSQWAIQISMLSGGSVSKQAVFDRIGKEAVAFAQSLLECFLLRQSRRQFKADLFSGFGKVLLQDSTTLCLPQSLHGFFKGNCSRGEQKAVARIQSIINVKKMQFLHFSLGSFTDNDQSASSSVLPWVNKGDLVIRDLGYFALSCFCSLISRQAYFLSRLRFAVNLYDEKDRQLCLRKLLRMPIAKDQWVYMGAKQKVRVRLIMIPLGAQQAAEKIRKAKRDRDKRLNHSKAYYQWLRYTVLITNVEEKAWTAPQAMQAYRVRWHIEIIFKSWKSGFHMQQLLHEGCTNENRVRVSIYLLLLFICLFIHKVYAPDDKNTSLLKLCKYAFVNIRQLFTISSSQLKLLIQKHCCYDKRKDRTKMTDLYQILT